MIPEPEMRGRVARRWLAAALTAGLLAAACHRRPPGVRVVLITLDTLRYDSFAAADSVMPRLNEWARQAAVFERCYASSSSTQPTHASLFTGLQPWQHGVPRNGARLAEERTTVAERLAAAGFSTAAVVASVPVGRRFGFAQGFEHFDDDFAVGTFEIPFWRGAAERVRRQGEEPPRAEEGFYSLAGTVVDRALARIDAARGARQFFWFHFFDPHSPYGDAAGGERFTYTQRIERLIAEGRDPWPEIELARELYAADVTQLDAELDRLLRRLERDRGAYETHVVIASDHGESFGEEGALEHSLRLTEEQIRVPCLIRSPRLEPGARRDVAGSVDFAATMLALAGLDAPEVGGRDLTLAPPPRTAALGMRHLFSEPAQERRVDGSVHMLPPHWFFWVDESGRLYRGNSEDIVPPAGEAAVDNLGRRVRELFATFEAAVAEESVEAVDDPELLRALRALGYAN